MVGLRGPGPVASRTRSRREMMYKRLHEEIKSKKQEESASANASGSASASGSKTEASRSSGGVWRGNSCGVSGKGNESGESGDLGVGSGNVREGGASDQEFDPDLYEFLRRILRGDSEKLGFDSIEMGEDNASSKSDSDDEVSNDDVDNDDDDLMLETSSEDSDSSEERDDSSDEDYREDKQHECSVSFRESSSEEDEEVERVKAFEKTYANRGKGERFEAELKKKNASRTEFSSDSNIDSDHTRNAKFDTSSVDGVPKCVAKRTRSHFTSESIKKKMKLGTFSQPFCVEKELDDGNENDDQDDCNENDDNSDIGERSNGRQSNIPEKVTIESRKWNGHDNTQTTRSKGDENVQDFCRVQTTKRKRIRSYTEHEVVNIIADSILDKTELPFQETKHFITEPTLPLKFTFGIEELTPPEKSEEEKILDEIWNEMALALALNDATLHTMVDEATIHSNDDTESKCHQGHHMFIIDDEIGRKCKFCSLVDLEIKYHVPDFIRHTWRRSRSKDFDKTKPIIFEDLCSDDSVCDSQSGHFPSSEPGRVWDIIPGIEKGMHAHQRKGFEFIWKNIAGGIHLHELKEATKSGSGCIISHAPGTGKTRLAIAFLQTYLKLYPAHRALIIAPCSMLLSWEAEFEKWKVNIPFHNLNKDLFSGKERTEAFTALRSIRTGRYGVKLIRMVKLYSWDKDGGILGISYRLFEELVAECKKNKSNKDEDNKTRQILVELPDVLVLDEGHVARNHQSNIWKALSEIRTEKRILLSGTPFQNNFDELYNTLCLVRPNFAERLPFKNDEDFVKRRGRKKSEARGKWDSLTNLIGKSDDERRNCERLHQLRAVIGSFVHTHMGDILQERLPGLRDSVLILEPHDLQKSLLDSVRGESSSIKGRSYLDLECLVSMVSVHPSLFCKSTSDLKKLADNWYNREGELDSLRLNPENGIKTKFLMALIQLCTARNERVLVFSQYLNPLELIKEQLESQNWVEGTDVLFMCGQLDIDKRQSLIRDFNDPKNSVKVLLASIKACSEGINLVGASRVVLLDVVWNPSVRRQAISRAFRLGQEKVVYVYHLITSGTLEEEKYCRQAAKERLSELVFYSADDSDNIRKTPSDVSDDKEDRLLETMLEKESLKGIFKKIIFQPKETNLVKSFGFLDLE